MNQGICLDPNSINFNINSLSGNGFAIYTDADNFTFPIAVNIPASLLFPTATGNCQFSLSNIPAGANQILVVDQCDGLPPSTPGAPDTPSYTCCYALLTIPDECISWCDECSITFDTFQTSSIGKLVAGNLTSTCGTVTDYVIGWYLNGDYSAPALTTGFGSAAGPYQFGPHPLTGSGAVPVVGGSWEGIIHDIVINGTLYSNIASGSKGGTPIPFESCFDTFIIDPLTCDNGTYATSSKYSHQFYFNSQAVGTTPSPVSLTYVLDPTTKYFAYAFNPYFVYDTIEIKWKSGDPNATSNPSLYSQPIYLENLQAGGDIVGDPPSQANPASAYSLQYAIDFNTTISNFNNKWPKKAYGGLQRVFTLANLETSSNPAAPDLIEITIIPNTASNNTKWDAGFQCLTDFDCTNCLTEDWPNNIPKIDKIHLQKTYTCPSQTIFLNVTGCFDYQLSVPPSDLIGKNIFLNNYGINHLDINLIGTYRWLSNTFGVPANLGGQSSCIQMNWNGTTSSPWTNYIPSSIINSLFCSPSPDTTITLNKTANQIKLTFNSVDDYFHYKNSIINTVVPNIPNNSPTSILCNNQNDSVIGTLPYYQVFGIFLPFQSPDANCGDTTTIKQYFFHINDYFNIQYVENPSSNFWSITIPQTFITNCSSYSQCSTCYNTINPFVFGYNNHVYDISSFSFTTNKGAKFTTPIWRFYINRNVYGGISGSICGTTGNSSFINIPWYGINTIPFISSSNGWVNLPSLGDTIPCDISMYPRNENPGIHICYLNQYQVVFPHMTGSFNYSLSTNDFEIYALTGPNTTPSGSRVQPYSCPTGSLIYSYIGGVATMHSSSYFWQGNNPTLIIDP